MHKVDDGIREIRDLLFDSTSTPSMNEVVDKVAYLLKVKKDYEALARHVEEMRNIVDGEEEVPKLTMSDVYLTVFGPNWVGEDSAALRGRLRDLVQREVDFSMLRNEITSFADFIYKYAGRG